MTVAWRAVAVEVEQVLPLVLVLVLVLVRLGRDTECAEKAPAEATEAAVSTSNDNFMIYLDILSQVY